MVLVAEETTILGQTGLEIPKLGIGAWSWGAKLFWGFGKDYDEQDVKEAFEASLAAGVNFFDTAEIYARGNSERLLGKFIASQNKPVLVATKFLPFPWRLWKGRLISALKASVDRLNLRKVDLYQIHQPLPPIPVETWAEGLADAVERGLASTVGVSNYNLAQMRRAQNTLEKRGIPLASNQVEYSLMNREIERNGLLDACLESGITLIAYSPLGQGILTGKYTPENPPTGVRGLRYRPDTLKKIQPLLDSMEGIGQDHGDKTIAQVAINWTICKGTVPIPGAKTAEQARENAGALTWRLTEDEIEALDHLSEENQV
jgi:aryl-alcohol dehydrogenase-like predicted oxidoreductase